MCVVDFKSWFVTCDVKKTFGNEFMSSSSSSSSSFLALMFKRTAVYLFHVVMLVLLYFESYWFLW